VQTHIKNYELSLELKPTPAFPHPLHPMGTPVTDYSMQCLGACEC